MSVKKVAFIMDPLEKVKAQKDTSYHLMLASRQLGHQVYYLDQRDLFAREGRLWADVTAVDVHADVAKPFTVGARQRLELAEMDAVLVRTDPPFDRTYFYTTLLLDLLPATTRVINRPQGLRNWNEKLAALFYPELAPTTLVTDKAAEIQAFMAEHGRTTLKPIDGFGGKGIVFLRPGGENIDQLIEMVTHGGRHKVIVQRYVPEATKGDKRILLLNGEPLGAILRLHPEGKELNNLDAGGTANPTELTDRDLHICRTLRAGLIAQGVYFCGIDILGDYLIEINVTSPTGLQQLCQFSGVAYNHTIMQTLLEQELPS